MLISLSPLTLQLDSIFSCHDKSSREFFERLLQQQLCKLHLTHDVSLPEQQSFLHAYFRYYLQQSAQLYLYRDPLAASLIFHKDNLVSKSWHWQHIIRSVDRRRYLYNRNYAWLHCQACHLGKNDLILGDNIHLGSNCYLPIKHKQSASYFIKL